MVKDYINSKLVIVLCETAPQMQAYYCGSKIAKTSSTRLFFR